MERPSLDEEGGQSSSLAFKSDKGDVPSEAAAGADGSLGLDESKPAEAAASDAFFIIVTISSQEGRSQSAKDS